MLLIMSSSNPHESYPNLEPHFFVAPETQTRTAFATAISQLPPPYHKIDYASRSIYVRTDMQDYVQGLVSIKQEHNLLQQVTSDVHLVHISAWKDGAHYVSTALVGPGEADEITGLVRTDSFSSVMTREICLDMIFENSEPTAAWLRRLCSAQDLQNNGFTYEAAKLLHEATSLGGIGGAEQRRGGMYEFRNGTTVSVAATTNFRDASSVWRLALPFTIFARAADGTCCIYAGRTDNDEEIVIAEHTDVLPDIMDGEAELDFIETAAGGVETFTTNSSLGVFDPTEGSMRRMTDMLCAALTSGLSTS
jgi:hypothetical protein